MRLIAFMILAVTTAFSTLAAAQEPPGRVGRIAYIEGRVALYQDPEVDWEEAYANSPLTSENSIWTEPGARAEVRVSGIALRLDHETQLDVARLDDDVLAGFLVRGSVALNVRWIDAGQGIEISTNHGQLRFAGVGRYRLDVDEARDETVLTVFAGTASLRAGNGDVRVGAGQALRIGNGTYRREGVRASGLDRWAEQRDAQWSDRQATRYVSPYMTGYEDLDRYGAWIQDEEYGALWYPTRVSADWVPYRTGHWTWVRPFGYTWVADEPWGYAPYHYGRWVYVRNRWCWTPGQRIARPVWAPALVAWVGGSNFSVSIGGRAAPAVGWYPLAPWERYEPWYRTSSAYNTRLNVVVRNAPPREWRREGRDRGDWRQWNRDRAATVVRREAIADRRPVTQALLPSSPEVVRNAQVVSPTNVFTREDFRRRREESTPRAQVPAGPPPAPQATQQPGPGGRLSSQPPQPVNPASRPSQPPREGERFENRERDRADRGDNRPNFQRRPEAVPAPAPAQAPAGGIVNPGQPAAQPQPQQGGPARQSFESQRAQQEALRRAQEQAQRETQEAQQRSRQDALRQQQEAQQRQQQDQQRQQREQQQQGAERAAREQQQAAERAAREQQQRAQQEAQQRQQQQQQQQQEAQRQQQQQQQQAAERAAREQQQRAQQEAQRQQQEAQRQQQQQQQQRQQQEAQRQQQEAQRQQQQAAERAAREQQQAAERAAREAQRQQQQQQRQAPPPQAQPQPQPQPPAQPQPQAQQPQAQQPQRERGPREDRPGRGNEDKDKKDRDDDNPGRGRGR